jgi:signal transduction histidine kinase
VNTVTSHAGALSARRNVFALPGRRRGARGRGGPSLVAIEALFADRRGHEPGVAAVLDGAWTRAAAAYAAAGADDAADRLAATLFAGDALAGLAVEGALSSDDTRAAAHALAKLSNGAPETATLELFLAAAANPLLTSLPPLFAVETSLRLLVQFELATEASLWMRTQPNRVEPIVTVGEDEPSRRVKLAARMVFAQGHAAAPLRSLIRGVPVLRWGRPDAALVVRLTSDSRPAAETFLVESARTLTPLLERALMLERSAEREATLVKGTERRLTRLGYDLHDGPIQEVLVLAAEMRAVRDLIFVAPPLLEHEHKAYDQLEDMRNRLIDLDRELRSIAHSLESRSSVNRPIEEVLHREVESVASRSGIAVALQVDGETSFLSASQRITLFRAAQEALSNAREHSGASKVQVVLRCRRAWTELSVSDDGVGFAVEPELARAARRGRLGLIGISERVRMLGGTFQLDSAEGGPTMLTVTLPRWEPLDPATADV